MTKTKYVSLTFCLTLGCFLVASGLSASSRNSSNSASSTTTAPGRVDSAVAALVRKARDLIETGKNKQALQVCNEALKLQHDSCAAHALRASIYAQSKLSDGYDELAEATWCPMRSADDYDSLGFALSDVDLTFEAADYLDQAIRLDPKNPQFFDDRAILFVKLRKQAEARADYKSASKLNAAFPANYSAAACILSAEGHHSEALKLYSKAIATNPSMFNLFSRAQLLAKNARPDDALKDYEVLLKREYSPQMCLAMMRQEMQCGKSEKALALLAAHPEVFEITPFAYLFKARALESLSKTIPALAALRQYRDASNTVGTWPNMDLEPHCRIDIPKSELVTYWRLKCKLFRALHLVQLSEQIEQVYWKLFKEPLLQPSERIGVAKPLRDIDLNVPVGNVKLGDVIKEAQAETHLIQGEALYIAYESDAAVSQFTEAIKLDGKMYAAYVERALANSSRRKVSQAVLDYKTAERICPTYLPAYYDEAECYGAEKDYQLALQCYDRMLPLIKPAHRNVLLAVSRMKVGTHFRLNQPALALKGADQLILKEPFNVSMYLLRAKIQFKLGAYEKALADCSFALDHLKVDDSSAGKTREQAAAAYDLRAQLYDLLHKPSLAAKDRQSSKGISEVFYDAIPFMTTHEINEKKPKP